LGGRQKEKSFERRLNMVEGSAEAIKAIGTTVSAYFPSVLGVVATLAGLGAVISFIRRAA
jgi:hypothetical protein